MVVLVNRYSASASEIVSACLQDHKRAVIVGERTWGKGSVQNIIELEDGRSALKLTTAAYHRPSGKNIHRFPDSKDNDEWGVMPDPGFDCRLTSEETAALLADRQRRDIVQPSRRRPRQPPEPAARRRRRQARPTGRPSRPRPSRRRPADGPAPSRPPAHAVEARAAPAREVRPETARWSTASCEMAAASAVSTAVGSGEVRRSRP